MMGERMKVILLIFASCFLFFFVSSFWNEIKSQEYNVDKLCSPILKGKESCHCYTY